MTWLIIIIVLCILGYIIYVTKLDNKPITDLKLCYCVYNKIHRLKNFKHFAKLIFDGASNITPLIKSIYNGYYIPVIDADNHESMIKACFWLDENKADYVVIESSTSHYWILINKCSLHWHGMRQWIKAPDQDEDYKSSSNDHWCCFLRACMQSEYFIPVITHKSKSQLLNDFAEKIVNHFGSDIVRWVWRYQTFESINLATSQPEDLAITLDDICDHKGVVI